MPFARLAQMHGCRKNSDRVYLHTPNEKILFGCVQPKKLSKVLKSFLSRDFEVDINWMSMLIDLVAFDLKVLSFVGKIVFHQP